MSGFAPKSEERKKDFKAAPTLDASRVRREETTVQIRKTKKDDRLNKRRQMNNTPTPAAPAATAVGLPVATDAQRLSNLPQMIAGVMSHDVAAQTEYTTQFRRLLSIEKNPPIQEVIQAGVVPRFVEFLGVDANPALQFEAAWALTNIASGTSQHTEVVMNHGAVPIFCRLLASPNDDVREQAVWALGNIAGDSPNCRNAVLAGGAMAPLLQLLQQNSKLSMLRNATWTLSNFCRGKPQPDFNLVKGCLPTLAQLIYSPDEEVLTDACWALSYLSDGPNEKIQAVIDTGVPRRLVDLLMHAQPSVQTPALRTVGNIVTGDDMQTQHIINYQALTCLHALLSSHKKGIRKEACWTISNITAGNPEQIQSVIEANIIPQLIQLLRNAEFDIKKESAWAISNATSGGSPEQIKYLVHQGCIGPLCDLLKVQDAKIITVALEGLENILKVGDVEMKQKGLPRNQMATWIEEAEGLDKIEELQQHDNDDIYNKVVKILSEYFEVEEEGDADIAPAVQGGQFAFGAAPQGGAAGGFNFS